MGEDYPGDRIFHNDFYKDGLDSWTQAYGLGKTHNIWIGFHIEQTRDHAAALTRSFVNKPVLALAAPEWNTATGALGRVHPEDRDNYPKLESVLDAPIHRKFWLQERLENYGWIDYGDVNFRLDNPLDPESITFSLWRRWASMFYGGPNVAPLLYLRSGGGMPGICTELTPGISPILISPIWIIRGSVNAKAGATAETEV